MLLGARIWDVVADDLSFSISLVLAAIFSALSLCFSITVCSAVRLGRWGAVSFAVGGVIGPVVFAVGQVLAVGFGLGVVDS